MVAYLITQIIGLLRNVVISDAFGTSAALDSFYAANRVTELLFNLVAGGVLGSAFIPAFTGLLAHHQRERAWKLASAVANLLLILLILISLLAAVFAPQIVRYGLYVLAPGQNSGQEDLSISLLRLMMPTVVIFGLSGLAMGILNAHQKFWLAAIAPAMYSLGQIAGVLFLSQSLGILRLAYGVLAGSGLFFLVLLPDLLRLQGKYHPSFDLGMPEVRQVMRLMGPRILGAAVVQINFIVNIMIALGLPNGSVSAITYAFTLMLMPQAAIAQSIAVAAMPTFSAQAAQGKLDDMRASLASSLRSVLLLAVPASLGLILLRTPLVRLLYEHNEFTPRSTEMVAWALLWYAAGLVGHCLLEVIVRAYYALQDTRTPVVVGVVAMSLNIAFSFVLSRWFSQIGWMPHGGLALANSLATALEMTALLILLRRKLGGLQGRSILSGLGLAMVSGLGMSTGLLVWSRASVGLPSFAVTLGGVILGGGIYLLGMLVLRVPEMRQLLDILRRRFSRI